MKLQVAVFLIIGAILLFAPMSEVNAQTYTSYKIQVQSDGSAIWVIKQVTSMKGTVDTLGQFQDRATSLVKAAETQTHRTMSVDSDSLQVSNAEITEGTMTTLYTFIWLNFTQSQNGNLKIGDVFATPSFFNFLYGDGALQINYPSNYNTQSITPTPDQTDESTQTLQWLGTQFFITEKPNIVIQPQQQAQANSGTTYLFAAEFGVPTIAISGSAIFVLTRKNKNKKTVLAPNPFETEEEKVLVFLRSVGGSIRQSTVMEQCKFSKTKTSELLSALETKGVVRRYKKGRDKIVSLAATKN